MIMSDDFDLIFSYFRKQAIKDGVLIDVTEMAKDLGFKWLVAVKHNGDSCSHLNSVGQIQSP